MESQTPANPKNPSEEIDLGQLFNLIGRGFNRLFNVFLRLFIYLRRHGIKLGILAVIGLAAGFGLNQIVTKKLKTEVIVKPNLESQNYLYDVIAEIQSNIEARDTTFFAAIGIKAEEIKKLKVVVEPMEKEEQERTDQDLKYLELLEKYRTDILVEDVVRTEILNNTSLNHRITFFYRSAETGRENVRKIMDYINSNEYFKELSAITVENAKERMTQNQGLVTQIDGLVANYSQRMSESGTQGEGRIILDQEEQLDITGLLNLKNALIRDIERKKLEILRQKGAIRVINLGTTQAVQKSFFGKNIVLIPLVLMGIYILIDLLRYLNRKANEFQN
ncbi:hypothetical protein [Poritiphilus flavus]|uniref:Chain length determinant protein n=1 Tax=Poritiphilus flavus TaxID=2697053 RepID=A0A6L9E8K5_9FLAO|nr:hypothetical protein [Poritiphilus flavus]NAS10984.1 hypothetical protein [Poritiphilus flavus]